MEETYTSSSLSGHLASVVQRPRVRADVPAQEPLRPPRFLHDTPPRCEGGPHGRRLRSDRRLSGRHARAWAGGACAAPSPRASSWSRAAASAPRCTPAPWRRSSSAAPPPSAAWASATSTGSPAPGWSSPSASACSPCRVFFSARIARLKVYTVSEMLDLRYGGRAGRHLRRRHVGVHPDARGHLDHRLRHDLRRPLRHEPDARDRPRRLDRRRVLHARRHVVDHPHRHGAVRREDRSACCSCCCPSP